MKKRPGLASMTAIYRREVLSYLTTPTAYVFVAVFLFAYSTMISWSYYGERCFVYLFGDRASTPYKIIYVVFVFLGSVITATNILNFGDLMILSMGLPNILGLLLLSGVVKRQLDSYMTELRSGRMQRYDKRSGK